QTPVVHPGPPEAVVQSVAPARPRLDGIADDPPAAPRPRPGHRTPLEAFLGPRPGLLQLLAATHRRRLVGAPGADLRAPGPPREVRVQLLLPDRLGPAAEADRPEHRRPRQRRRERGHLAQLGTLGRLEAGDEARPPRVEEA